MHAGRRAEFADLVRLFRIAHVVHGEAFRAVITRAADRADIGVALVQLDKAAAAPRRRGIVPEQAEVICFFGVGGHGASHFTVMAGLVPAIHVFSLPARRGCPAQGRA